MEKQRLKSTGHRVGKKREMWSKLAWWSGSVTEEWTITMSASRQSHTPITLHHKAICISNYKWVQLYSYASFVRKKHSSNWKKIWQGSQTKMAQQCTFHPTFILNAVSWECWVVRLLLHALSWNHTFCFLEWKPWENKCSGGKKKRKRKGIDKQAREREERKEIGGITGKLSAKEVELVSPRAQGLYFEINRKTLNSFTCHST